MKKLLNTLYLTTQGAYLHKEGETVVVEVDGQLKLRLPLHSLESIICFGNVICSSFLLAACGEHGINVSFLTQQGRFLYRIQGGVSGNVLLRLEQYRRSQAPQESIEIARNVVMGKIANLRTVIRRAVRDHPECDGDGAMTQAAMRWGHQLQLLPGIDDLDELRGVEGNVSKEYFAIFDRLITTDKEAFFMRERSRRPPLDNLNALLSFLYTLLTHDAVSACESIGLDPQVGFLHAIRPGRPSLALDLVEEFRPLIADRLSLSLVNLKQITRKGFKTTESGAVIMDDDTRKEVLTAYQKRKQELITHPFLQEKVPIGLLLHLQAMLLARHLRGDLEAYPPFLWR